MRKLAIIVFAAAALAATDLAPEQAPQPAGVEGRGLFAYLACGACLGSGAALAAVGLGPFYAALMAAGDGTLADACLSQCSSL